MDESVTVLCGSSAYNKKYYLDSRFERLPEQIKQDLQIMCVLFTEEVGGVITLSFTEEGELVIETSHDEGDLLYDDISAGLLIRKMRSSREEFFKALELYYKIFILKMNIEDIED